MKLLINLNHTQKSIILMFHSNDVNIIIYFKLNGLNGHFRNNVYNSARWAYLVSLAPKRENLKYHSVWLWEMGNSCSSVFPNTRAW